MDITNNSTAALGMARNRPASPSRMERVPAAPRAQAPPLALFDSYHCSRYNTNTRVLTPEMFRAVFAGMFGMLAIADS